MSLEEIKKELGYTTDDNCWDNDVSCFRQFKVIFKTLLMINPIRLSAPWTKYLWKS